VTKHNPVRAGVIDIGSNTIKVLAGEKRNGEIHILADEAIEARISTGMTGDPPRLSLKAMETAVEAVRTLLRKTTRTESIPVEIAATSAVRDAANSREFSDRIQAATSIPLRILTGEEEAEGIARGIAQERGLDPQSDYTVNDLGGGSLEWIHQRAGTCQTALSMDLGAVRLLHRLVSNPADPLSGAEIRSIRDTCRLTFEKELPPLERDPLRTHWGTGGAFTITRLLMATEEGRPLRKQPREIPVTKIRSFAEQLGRLSLAERKNFPGLPETRADILPVALLVLDTLAEHTGAEVFRHSFYNLRMGRLALLLDSLDG